ncbi:MAG: AraC family transcriptional regulator [Balneolaceae bacterium]|nr:MAG: AraC family transcriptional regulator [Balneolaceae bacterium]
MILLLGFFISLFLLLLLIGKKDKTLADNTLLCMFAVYAITIGGPYLEIYNRENEFPHPHLINNAWLFLLLHGPLLWLYVKSLTEKEFKIKPLHLLHLTPFAVFLVLHMLNYLFLSADEKILLAENELFTTTLFFKIRGISIGVFSIGYNIWALKQLRNYRVTIENQFSNIESIDLSWLKTLVIASLIVFSVNVLVFNINNYLNFANFYEIAVFAYSFSTLYVLYIGYFGIRQGRIFVDYPITENDQRLESTDQGTLETVVNKDYSHIITRLTLLMESEQPYLDPELNLAKLSKLMNTKPGIISEVLNSTLNQNFFDFVNKYRVEEFKLKCLINDNKHLSILGIAFDCGFNSKAAFYRAFNKFEGISPSAYISKVS